MEAGAPKPPPSPGEPATGEQPKPPTGEQPSTPPHSTDPHERIDGLRAWLAKLDRKLSVRTYALGAATVLALAAAAVAIVLILQTQEDSATKSDLRDLRGELGAVEESATEAAAEDIESVSERLGRLEDQVSSLRSDQRTGEDELSVVQDDIDDIRKQINDLERSVADAADAADAADSGGTGPGDTDSP
jgi:uncharacterized phage infection (PIP) family protein YhgE